MGWYNASWTYRQKITVDNTKVSASLSNFPVYLDLSQLSSGFFSHVQSSGADIRITTSDGETEVPREVVSVDTSNSKGEVHFKAGSLSGSTDTEFYIYYGNSGASEPAEDATYGRENVWDSNYQAVWHFQGSAGSTQKKMDSTSHDRDLTEQNTPTSGTGFGGQSDGCYDLDGASSEHLTLSSFGFDDGWYVSAWVNVDNREEQEVIYERSGENGYGLQLEPSEVRTLTGSGSFGHVAHSKDVTDSNWHYIGVYFNNSSSSFEADGSNLDTLSQNQAINNPGQTVGIGRNVSNNRGNLYGKIDELRISNAQRSASWHATEYNNQNSPSTFYTIGSEETDGGGGTTFTPKVIMF